MYSSSVEQIIKTKAPGNAWIFKGAGIVASVLALTTIPATGTFGLLLFVLFVVVTVLVFRYYNAEYEYSITDGELTVDKIMSRSWRKRCGVYNIARAELIADLDSQEALRLERRQLRTNDYTANEGDEGVIVVYAFNADNETERIFLEPNDKMLLALSQVAPKGAYKVERAVSEEEVECIENEV